ncbi:hypothetical protein BH20VER1_BH20VER1_29510 [soil metagenome]
MKPRLLHSLGALLSLALVVQLGAQPVPKPTATPAAATPSPTPAPTAAPTTSSLIDAMNPADLQQAVQLLKNHYINPQALNEAELNRAMLAGILARLGRGVMLLPQPAADPTEAAHPFYSEVLEGHVGYVRLGALTPVNLQAMDAALQTFAGKKIDALVVDLRGSPSTNDFATGAEFAKRFCARGKPLFTLRKPAAKQERPFVADREPAYQGMMIVLADGDTSGPGEAIAGALRLHNKALVIGQPTAGRAVEYADLPLNGGRVLRVAVAEAVLPEGRPLFPGGLKPDLPVEMPPADKRLVFAESVAQGMGPFVYDAERPGMNEAALLAGRNPELEAMEAAQKRGRTGEKLPPRDPVIQRALDLVTSLAIYQQR